MGPQQIIDLHIVAHQITGLNRNDWATIESVGPNIPMATDRKIEPKLADAAAKTTAVLESLRSRLNRGAIPQETPQTEPTEAPDELGRQLEQYFAATPPKPAAANGSAVVRIPNEIRSQVIDGVVDKILKSWGAPNGEIPASIKSEVIARLVEHVLGELLKKGANTR
jgi:hypothetical protein